MPLLLSAAWTSFTLSFEICPLPDARRDEPMLPLRSRWVCTSLPELLEPVPLVPRLLPLPDGSDDFSDPDGDEPPLEPPVWDHA